MNWNYIDRISRQWIRAQDGIMASDYVVQAMERALAAHKKGNPSPLILSISRCLGADRDTSESIAIVGHMLYCAVGLVDDIQDGDSHYLGDMKWSQQLNIALVIRELALKRLYSMESITSKTSNLICNSVLDTTLNLISGQVLDLYREYGHWDIALFERVARCTAGSEFGLMLYMASLVSDSTYAYSLRQAGESFGVVLQIRHDLQSKDKRISSCTEREIKELTKRVLGDFNQAVQSLPSEVQIILQSAIRKGEQHNDYTMESN